MTRLNREGPGLTPEQISEILRRGREQQPKAAPRQAAQSKPRIPNRPDSIPDVPDYALPSYGPRDDANAEFRKELALQNQTIEDFRAEWLRSQRNYERRPATPTGYYTPSAAPSTPQPEPSMLRLLARDTQPKYFPPRGTEAYVWPLTRGNAKAESGGFLISNDKLPPVLTRQPSSLIETLPITTRYGCVGDFSVPVFADFDVSFQRATVAPRENEPVAELSEQVRRVVPFAPFSVGGRSSATRSLLLQSQFAEAQALQTLLDNVAAKMSHLLLNGSGQNEPFGLLSDPDVPTETGALDTDLLAACEERVLSLNPNEAALGWVINPSTLRLLRQIPVLAGSEPLVPSEATTLLGRPLYVSMHCPPEKILFGDWSQFMIAVWGEGLSVLLNPYGAGFGSGTVEMRAMVELDYGVLKPGCFVIATPDA